MGTKKTYLRVLSKSYLMDTYMIGFRCLDALDKNSLSIVRIRVLKLLPVLKSDGKRPKIHQKQTKQNTD